MVYPLPQRVLIERSELERFRRENLETDDVFQTEYLKNFVLLGDGDGRQRVEDGAKKLLDEWTKNWLHLSHSPGENIAPGPYVYAEGKTWQPWRIYRDASACFMKTFKPSEDGSGR